MDKITRSEHTNWGGSPRRAWRPALVDGNKYDQLPPIPYYTPDCYEEIDDHDYYPLPEGNDE